MGIFDNLFGGKDAAGSQWGAIKARQDGLGQATGTLNQGYGDASSYLDKIPGYLDNAKTYLQGAQQYPENAKAYYESAKQYPEFAKQYYDEAKGYNDTAKGYLDTAQKYPELAKGYYDSAKTYLDDAKGNLTTAAGRFDPLTGTAQQGFNAYGQAYGVGGGDPMAAVRAQPGYQFAQNEGREAVLRGQGAAGMSASGNTLQAIYDRGANIADSKWAQYAEGLKPFLQLAPQMAQMQGGYDAQKGAYDAQKGAYETQKAGLETSKGGYEAQKAALEASKGNWAAQQAGLEASKGQYDVGQAALEASKGSYEAQQAALEAQKSGYATGQAGLETGLAGLLAQLQSGTANTNANGIIEAQNAKSAASKNVFDAVMGGVKLAAAIPTGGMSLMGGFGGGSQGLGGNPNQSMAGYDKSGDWYNYA